MFLISILRKEKKIDGDLLVIEYYCSACHVFITAVNSSIVVVYLLCILEYAWVGVL